MAGIGAIGGIPGSNPLSGMANAGGNLGGSAGGGPLSGMANIGVGGNTGGASENPGSGIAPTSSATQAQGGSFGDTLRAMIIEKPSQSKSESGMLAARFAAGENIDPHQLAIASAKAGVEIQMATRTISSAVSAVRTLFQMQI